MQITGMGEATAKVVRRIETGQQRLTSSALRRRREKGLTVSVSRSFFERTLTAVSMAAACSRNPRVISARPFAVNSTWRTRRSSARFLRETSPFLTSRSTATLMDPGVSLRADCIHREGSFMKERFEDAEIRVAQFCPLDALLRVRGQRLKGFHEDEPDMNAGGVLRLSGSFPLH